MRPGAGNGDVSGDLLTVGLDASRSRSGGAVAHIKGIIGGGDPRAHGIALAHLWADAALLKALPDLPWLVKHEGPGTHRSFVAQLLWQRRKLPDLARRLGIDVMFNTDAGSVCPFQPSATLSQDMLSYEPGEITRFPWTSKARLRLEALKHVQLARLGRSTVAIFLTEYAASVIGPLARARQTAIIPHGIDQSFMKAGERARFFPSEGTVRCLYVSNAALYKHQWHVIEGTALARSRSGRDIRLRLVGGGKGEAQARIDNAVAQFDPERRFVEQVAFVPNAQIVEELAAADLFVFASSCENMPVTLLEAMAAGLPIASSDRGPMPEVLGPAMPYFNPESPGSIADALCELISDPDRCKALSQMAHMRAKTFTWAQSSAATWRLLASLAATKRT